MFTSPSSAREADGDGDGADILENNRRAWWQLNQAKVKMCVASIINMRRVTPRAIAYVICQVSIFDYPPTIDMPDVVYGRFVLLYPASHHGVLWMVI